MRGLGSQSLASRVILSQVIPSFLAASPQRSLPEFGDEEAERGQRPTVGRHGVVVEVALDDLSQPFPLDRDRLMLSPTQLLLDACSFARMRSRRVFLLKRNLP
jgi:hypothetical protein